MGPLKPQICLPSRFMSLVTLLTSVYWRPFWYSFWWPLYWPFLVLLVAFSGPFGSPLLVILFIFLFVDLLLAFLLLLLLFWFVLIIVKLEFYGKWPGPVARNLFSDINYKKPQLVNLFVEFMVYVCGNHLHYIRK